jgi:hypothetical protein
MHSRTLPLPALFSSENGFARDFASISHLHLPCAGF